MKKYILSIVCFISLSVSSCNYLDMVPEKDIETIETIFERRTDVENWWVALYGEFNFFRGNAGYYSPFLGADEYIASPYLQKSNLGGLQIASGLQMSQQPYCPIWTSMYQIIRNCNVFLENIHRTYNLSDAERKWWIADVKALKAQIYFELIRHYGPIIIIDEAVPVDLPVESYQLPRQPVDFCLNHVIKLLDEAKKDIPMHKDRTKYFAFTLCLEGLYALKAKVLLYAASPLFNGNIHYSDFVNKNGEHLFSQNYDREKWRLAAEAADEAVEICSRGDRALYEHDGGQKTNLLNYMADVGFSSYSNFDNEEFLIEAKIEPGYYTLILPRLESSETHFYLYADGGLSPSMKMVEMYYTVNGLPIDKDNTWNYSNRHRIGKESSHLYEDVLPLNTDIVNLHLQREPRFYASIAGDRMYYQRGTNTMKESYNLLVEAHKGEEPWGTSLDIISGSLRQNITGYWVKKSLNPNFPTKGYPDHLQKNETIAMLRMAELYLIQSEAWNEYLEAPDHRVYDPINKVRLRAGIPTVQESWKNYSYLTDKFKSREGMRDIIRQEYNIELAFEGHRFWNIRRWTIADEEMNTKQYCWNILGESFQSFYNNENGPAYEVNNYKFIAPRDYFAPIKAEQILISGMKQNPGW